METVSEVCDQVENQIDDQVWDQVMHQIDYQVWGQVENQVDDKAWFRRQVWFQVLWKVREEVNEKGQ